MKLLSLLFLSSLCLSPELLRDESPRGQYVEARTASVFAGACHYGGEYTTQGREAVLAWSFEGGETDGVPLAGLELVAVVQSRANLAEGTGYESVVFLDPETTEVQQRALLATVEEHAPGLLGRVVAVNRSGVDVSFAKDAYSVRAGKSVELRGSLLPDRDCCKMPFAVWYPPFAPMRKPIVGCSEVLRVKDETLKLEFTRENQNDAFAGAFHWRDAKRDVATETCCAPK